jgi:hypothetical protein
MKERRMPGIIENTVAARVLPLKSTFLSHLSPTEMITHKSEFLDDDVRSLVGEVYAG